MNYNRVLLTVLLLLTAACDRNVRIAVIPRTTGVIHWEAERIGAEAAARVHGFEIYWNAPTREDDIEGQIALLERVRMESYSGVVLAPDQALALMTPVRKLLEHGMSVAVVSSPLPLTLQPGLSYIVNDDYETGRLAARHLGFVLHGKGSVALLSLDPNLVGLMMQVRAFEATLSREFPEIVIVDRRLGAFNGAEAQQITHDVLARNPQLSAFVCFTVVATRGTYLALQEMNLQRSVKLLGCEQDTDILEAVGRGDIDSVIAEDTYQMGYQAIEAIAADRSGRRVRRKTLIPPLLVTKDNVNSTAIKRALDYD